MTSATESLIEAFCSLKELLIKSKLDWCRQISAGVSDIAGGLSSGLMWCL